MWQAVESHQAKVTIYIIFKESGDCNSIKTKEN